MDPTEYEALRKRASTTYIKDKDKRSLAINLIELEHKLDSAQSICTLLLDKNPLIGELGIAYTSVVNHITKAQEIRSIRRSLVLDLEEEKKCQ